MSLVLCEALTAGCTHPFSPTIVIAAIGSLSHPTISTHTELPVNTRKAKSQDWDTSKNENIDSHPKPKLLKLSDAALRHSGNVNNPELLGVFNVFNA